MNWWLSLRADGRKEHIKCSTRPARLHDAHRLASILKCDQREETAECAKEEPGLYTFPN